MKTFLAVLAGLQFAVAFGFGHFRPMNLIAGVACIAAMFLICILRSREARK